MQTKTFSHTRVKDATLGIVEAVFASHLVDEATLKLAGPEVIDKDGDVTLKGAFTQGQEVVVSAYGHASWQPGAPPIGKGVIREEGDEAIATLQFFMDIPAAADTFKAVAALGDLQEWSYSLHDVTASRATVGGKSVQVLQKVGLVKEVSPVLMGAGVRTRTLSTKSGEVDPDLETETHHPKSGERLQFSEHVAQVMADVDALTARASEIKALRAEKGKTISDTTLEQLGELADRLEAVKALTIVEPEESPTPDAAQAEWLRFVALSQGVS